MSDVFSRILNSSNVGNRVDRLVGSVDKIDASKLSTTASSNISELKKEAQDLQKLMEQSSEDVKNGIAVNMKELESQVDAAFKSIEAKKDKLQIELNATDFTDVSEKVKSLGTSVDGFVDKIKEANQSLGSFSQSLLNQLGNIKDSVNSMPNVIDKMLGSKDASAITQQINEAIKMLSSGTLQSGSQEHQDAIEKVFTMVTGVAEKVNKGHTTLSELANNTYSGVPINITEYVSFYKNLGDQTKNMNSVLAEMSKQIHEFASNTSIKGSIEALSNSLKDSMKSYVDLINETQKVQLNFIGGIHDRPQDQKRMDESFVDRQLGKVNSGQEYAFQLREAAQALQEIAIARGGNGESSQSMIDMSIKSQGLTEKIQLVKETVENRNVAVERHMKSYDEGYQKQIETLLQQKSVVDAEPGMSDTDKESKKKAIDTEIEKQKNDYDANREKAKVEFTATQKNFSPAQATAYSQEIIDVLMNVSQKAGQLKKTNKTDLDNMSDTEKALHLQEQKATEFLNKTMQGNANAMLATLNTLIKDTSDSAEKKKLQELSKALVEAMDGSSQQVKELGENIKQTNMTFKEFFGQLKGVYNDLQGASKGFFGFFNSANLLDPSMWKNEVYKQSVTQGDLESQMALGEMAYGGSGHSDALFDANYYKGRALHERTAGMVDQYDFNRSFNAYNTTIQGQYGEAADTDAMVNFSTTSSLLSKAFGVNDSVIMGAVQTFYKDLKMSAEEANIEILDIADASKDLNVPFEKMISTVSSLAKEFRNMGMDGGMALNAIGNLTSEGVSLDIAEGYAKSVGKAMTSMDQGMIAFGASTFLGENDFTKSVTDYTIGLYDIKGDPNKKAFSGLADIAEGYMDMYAGLGSSDSEKRFTLMKLLQDKFKMGTKETSMAIQRYEQGESLGDIFSDFGEKGLLGKSPEDRIADSQDKLVNALEVASKELSGITRTTKAIEAVAGATAKGAEDQLRKATDFSKSIYAVGEKITGLITSIDNLGNIMLGVAGAIALISGASALGGLSKLSRGLSGSNFTAKGALKAAGRIGLPALGIDRKSVV